MGYLICICWEMGSHRNPKLQTTAFAFGYPPQFDCKILLLKTPHTQSMAKLSWFSWGSFIPT